jgi:hypothetical protein
MLVCPSCRHANPEEIGRCQRCGTSLEPGFSALLPVRRTEGERPVIEVPKPKPPSKARPYVVMGILVAAVVAVGAFSLLRPNACENTNFESDNFGYCVLVPEGWEAGPARFGADVTLDQFAPPAESATVVVEAVDLEDLEGVGLDDWSDYVRRIDEEGGLAPGPASETRLGDVQALQWDATVESGGATFRMREVVAVRAGVGWRITLNDLADAFGTSAVVFQGIIDSWKFS